MSQLARVAIEAIEAYQKAGGGRTALVECNFTPSCSEYAKAAIQQHGLLSGARLGVARLRRCNNKNQFGVVEDPVPRVVKGGRMASQESVEREADEIRTFVRDLPDEIRRQYYRRVQKKIRDPDTYAVMSYFLMTGLRHMYLGRWLRGLADIFGLLLGLGLVLSGNLVGLLLILAIGVLEVHGLFRSQVIVRQHNNLVAKKTLKKLTENTLNPFLMD